MAKEVGILFYRNIIEHCKVELHFIKKRNGQKMTLQKQEMSIEVDIHFIRTGLDTHRLIFYFRKVG